MFFFVFRGVGYQNAQAWPRAMNLSAWPASRWELLGVMTTDGWNCSRPWKTVQTHSMKGLFRHKWTQEKPTQEREAFEPHGCSAAVSLRLFDVVLPNSGGFMRSYGDFLVEIGKISICFIAKIPHHKISQAHSTSSIHHDYLFIPD